MILIKNNWYNLDYAKELDILEVINNESNISRDDCTGDSIDILFKVLEKNRNKNIEYKFFRNDSILI